MNDAIGLIETKGVLALVNATDAMAKAADVTVVKRIQIGGGFVTTIRGNIQQLIWDKMFTNVSLSAVTAILSVEMDYIASNAHAWYLTERLVREAAAVARGMGLEADDEKLLAKVRETSAGSPGGVTSICADIRAGRKTEVDTISGSVVRASKKCGVPAPTHEFVVEMIHALEERKHS